MERAPGDEVQTLRQNLRGSSDRGKIVMSDRWLVALLIVSVALSLSVSVSARVDPETNKIRYLMIGEIKAEHQSATAYMRADPKIDLTLIPAGDVADPKTSKRFVRIYIPRTEAQLRSNFDVVELFDFVPYILQDKHIKWIRDAVYEDGVGLALTEMGWYGVTDWTGNDAAAWMATVLYDAYPVDLVIGKQNVDTAFMVIKKESPLVDLPGFETTPLTGVQHHGIEIARPGSTVLTVWKAGGEDAIVSGTFGEGRTLMIPMGWDNIPMSTQRSWYYFSDFVLNHAYFVAQVRIPEDLEMIHNLRDSFIRYANEKSSTTALMDFIDKFGANTRPVERMLGELETKKKEAERLYLKDRYEEAADAMKDVIQGFQRISDQAVRIRERALLWVYITEWFAVTGTAIICGSLVWTLMVKRRYYKEVSVTRSV